MVDEVLVSAKDGHSSCICLFPTYNALVLATEVLLPATLFKKVNLGLAKYRFVKKFTDKLLRLPKTV
jgi:hypothetical protein